MVGKPITTHNDINARTKAGVTAFMLLCGLGAAFTCSDVQAEPVLPSKSVSVSPVVTPIAEERGQVYADPRNGTFWALFGYQNNAADSVTIRPDDATNQIDGEVLGIFANTDRDEVDLGEPLDRAPIEFQPGRQRGAFWINFERQVAWTIHEQVAIAALTTDSIGEVRFAQPVELAARLALEGGITASGNASTGSPQGPPPAGPMPEDQPFFDTVPTAVPSPSAVMAGAVGIAVLTLRRRRGITTA